MPKQSFSSKPSARGKRRQRARGASWTFAQNQEIAGFTEYMQYLHNRPRLFMTNFIAGLMRGLGFAIGFSVLGAVVVMLVQKLALANLPGIGDFFAEVVRIVQMKLY